MNPVAASLAAMAGGVLGVVAHESIHYAVARALGDVVGVGWTGGLAGRLFVDFRVPTSAFGWRSEAIRKAPLAAGLGGAIALVATFDGVTLPWLVGAGVVWGLLWTSPEDLFASQAQQDEQPQEIA
jgi:hypothetical protein